MRVTRKGATVSLVLSATAAAAILGISQQGISQSVPTDPQPTCPISPATFAAMFESGTVTLNGTVKPADSTQVLQPNCGFFVWSEQMFLWLTSPAPTRYGGGGGGRIMFSPSFYTVSPEDSSGRRSFIPNNPRLPFRMMLRATELGPHLLPIVRTRTGQIVEVQRPNPRLPVPPVVRGLNGAQVRLSSARVVGGQLQFLDVRGRAIQVRKLQLPTLNRVMVRMPESNRLLPMVPVQAVKDAIQARKIILNKIPIFIDSGGNVIDVEPGQADGGVLLSQNGSLIYYITIVNDMFAYHRTMQGPAVIPFVTPITFPLTAANAATVTAFASSHGRTLTDPEALTIETKSSWVDASAVPDPSGYVQLKATVPTFDKSNPAHWVPNGQTTITVAMVGLHVVGSTNGHGEMVWGTFEHTGNAPNASYQYNSTSGLKTVAQNTVGTWLFTPSGSSGPFNGQITNFPSWDIPTGAIDGPSGNPVGPTAVLRTLPWGTSGTNASLNTQVISANAAVIGQLLGGDLRRNYFQLGSTWTIGGAPPNNNNQVGTNRLSNATLETFVQEDLAHPGSGANCFSCHGTNTVSVSHVYGTLKPLF
ncbi:hypothetical protein HL653_18915 [Sphingomonas sp. AP4-R1]|uniref:hypothetical protein n=1 Tax=Sphingomonas sp. AP4-R1 TaxID=2735134 RepID=UPI001493858D|nr:hypothetical protein [Sphingomonas sp. AP4-R1]QJU59551.1 hypothetical protein HL653_18915 [Sphingomonas sp. AP4-R1]